MKVDKLKNLSAYDTELHRSAKERLHSLPGEVHPLHAEKETQWLVHELEVHQIELEMQNSELRQARDKVETLLATYTDLYDFAPVGYFILDRSGTIQSANLTGAGFLGIERSRLIGRSFGLSVSIGDRTAFVDFLGKVFTSQTKETSEVTLLTEGNTLFVAQIEAMAVDSSEECRIAVIDITERKNAEEERIRLEAQLQQAQKMESVGRLAGGVAHDFNNMLTVIIGYADLALRKMDPSLTLFTDLQEIRKAAERSAELTRQLLAFARKQNIAPKVLDLNDTVAGMLKMLHRLIGEDIHLNWQPKGGLWPVKVDPSQIDQILANLCVNARDAISGVGKITLETGNCAFDVKYCTVHAGFNPGEYVRLAVSDDGCGMNKEILSHLFEPFFTTKVVGKGTGLGLATVYGIVKQNNGFINVYSEPDHGSTFKIYLPRYADQTDQVWTEGEPEPARRGHETVLLVEDEPAILKMLTHMLMTQGYTVLPAALPDEAVRLSREYTDEIHLLVTDVVMPKMNGRDLATTLLSFFPHLKCLFMSGYTADVIAHHGVLDEGVNFIEKPFLMQELAIKVREVLDSP
jgi:PAS domain S-box-containing protein